MNRLKFTLILIFTTGFSLSQNFVEKTLVALKESNIEQADNYSKRISNQYLRSLFRSQIHYYKKGKLDPIYPQGDKDIQQESLKKKIISRLLLADYYYLQKDLKKNDDIFKLYHLALKESEKISDTLLITESLRKINTYILYRSRDPVISKSFLNKYQQYSNWSKADKFWYYCINIGYVFMLTENDISSVKEHDIDNLFNTAYASVNKNSFLEASLYQMKGIYAAHWLSNFEQAIQYNNTAVEILKKIPHWNAQNKLKGLAYNNHINHYKAGNYRKAVDFFRKDLLRKKEPLYKMYTNEWLYKCYESLKQYDSAHFYFKEMIRLKDKMKQTENALKIKSFEHKYNFEEKQKELEQLAKEKSMAENNFYVIVPILGLVTLLLIFIFYLYKRYKRKSTTLEDEKSETLQKLDELKEIVIKNHIILKDKTKVYIADLLYIKSDDHYLNIFMSNGKNHFVRGKLGKIIEKLPPNFIRCHRSYIVNRNFIKQINTSTLTLIDKTNIPISRSYKDNLE